MFLALTRLLEAQGCPRMDTKQELCPLWTCNQTGDAEGKGTNPHVPAEILQTAGSSRNTRGYIGGQLSYGWESSGEFILERTQTLIFLFPSSLHGESRNGSGAVLTPAVRAAAASRSIFMEKAPVETGKSAWQPSREARGSCGSVKTRDEACGQR